MGLALTQLPLSLRLFGQFEAQVDGVPLPPLRTRKGEWLLSLLALRAGGAIERRWLAGTLWPDSPEALALRNLRTSLADLRQALGREANRLQSPTPHTLRLDPSGAAVDVAAFDQAIRHGDPPDLEQAVALYRGPLLEGCTEEWVFQERQAREEAYLTALETLAAQALAGRDEATAERHLRRAVAVDPLRETAQRALMQALAASGNYAAAMGAYRELRLLLHREINVEPDAESQALFQRLRAEARAKAVDSTQRVVGCRDKRAAPGAALPPLWSLEAFSQNLPLQLTSFIGREDQTAEVQQLLAAHRLVTLTGAGGCGKTRLALQVAAELLETFPDGVWFVELASLADPALVPQAVATVLGVQETPGRSLIETLIDSVRARRLLLLLDNCEHLVGACAHVAEKLLQACPNLQILATSREPLGIGGETPYRVPSLSLPEAGPLPSVARLTQSKAVRLFIERAVTALPTFTVILGNAPAVAGVCRRLDGIPLAIELAAARVKALPVEQIEARLDDMFRLLTGGSRTALPRHQTLRALIDWSYDLLSEEERALLRRLSVFAGGWTLEAAERVCSGEGMEAWEVLDLLTALVEKSLVQYGEQDGEARYRLPETVRQYARDRLLESGEAEEMRHRHRDRFLEMAERAEPELRGAQQLRWLNRLEVEHDNLRAALECCEAEEGGAEVGLRFVAALWRFWVMRAHFREGRQWTQRVLSRRGAGSVALRARALLVHGILADWQGEHASSHLLIQESLALARTARDPWGAAFSLFRLGFCALDEENDAQAQALAEECLGLAQQVGDKWLILHGLALMAEVAHARGEFEPATRLCQESVALSREVGDQWVGAQRCLAFADLMRSRGHYAQAMTLHREGLVLSVELRDKRGIAWHLEGLAGVAAAQGRPDEAVRLMGASEALREAVGAELSPHAGPGPHRPDHEHTVASTRAILGAAAFAARWEEGRAMSLEQAMCAALAQEEIPIRPDGHPGRQGSEEDPGVAGPP